MLNNKTYIGMRCPPVGVSPENDPYLGSGHILKRAISKYGKDCFVKSILWDAIPSKRIADYFERFTIWLWRKIGAAEYNIADGGQGGYLGDVVNAKRIKSLRGHTCTEDTREKISRSHRGTHRSIESINKQVCTYAIKITAFKISKTIKEWSYLTGISEICLRDRLKMDGMTPEVAFGVGSKCILDFFVEDFRNVRHPLKNIDYNPDWIAKQRSQDKIFRNNLKRKKQSDAWRKHHKNNYITAWGITKIEKEWVAITGLNRGTLRARLKRGVSSEIALSYRSNCVLRFIYPEYAKDYLCYTGK
jgi:hypothetical protein